MLKNATPCAARLFELDAGRGTGFTRLLEHRADKPANSGSKRHLNGGNTMYAIIKTGGKQYRVKEGDTLAIERLEGEKGETVVFDEVLLISGDDAIQLGRPLVEGAKVSGTIVEQGRGRKIVIFKYRRRKNYRLKKGHRQYFTRVRVDSIAA